MNISDHKNMNCNSDTKIVKLTTCEDSSSLWRHGKCSENIINMNNNNGEVKRENLAKMRREESWWSRERNQEIGSTTQGWTWPPQVSYSGGTKFIVFFRVVIMIMSIGIIFVSVIMMMIIRFIISCSALTLNHDLSFKRVFFHKKTSHSLEHSSKDAFLAAFLSMNFGCFVSDDHHAGRHEPWLSWHQRECNDLWASPPKEYTLSLTTEIHSWHQRTSSFQWYNQSVSLDKVLLHLHSLEPPTTRRWGRWFETNSYSWLQRRDDHDTDDAQEERRWFRRKTWAS